MLAGKAQADLVAIDSSFSWPLVLQQSNRQPNSKKLRQATTKKPRVSQVNRISIIHSLHRRETRANLPKSKSQILDRLNNRPCDQLCPQLPTPFQKKSPSRQAMGMERDLRSWFGRQQAQGFHERNADEAEEAKEEEEPDKLIQETLENTTKKIAKMGRK